MIPRQKIQFKINKTTVQITDRKCNEKEYMKLLFVKVFKLKTNISEWWGIMVTISDCQSGDLVSNPPEATL